MFRTHLQNPCQGIDDLARVMIVLSSTQVLMAALTVELTLAGDAVRFPHQPDFACATMEPGPETLSPRLHSSIEVSRDLGLE